MLALSIEDIEKIKENFFNQKSNKKNILFFFNYNELKEKFDHLYLLPVSGSIVSSLKFHVIKDIDICNLLNVDKLCIPCLNYLNIDINCPFCIASNIYHLDGIFAFNNLIMIGIDYDFEKYIIIYDQEFIKEIVKKIDDKSMVIYLNLKSNKIKELSTSRYQEEIDSIDVDDVIKIFKKSIEKTIHNLDDILEILKEKIKTN